MLRLLLIFILTTPLPAQADNKLPDLGSPGLVIYDKQTEVNLGHAFTQALHSQVDLNQDPEIVSYIRRIGHLLASYTQQQRHFKFYVINDASINAFAGPNGVIGMHTGLITAADSEDELASVLAHEISHVTQLHLARRFERQSNLSLATFASILAAVLIGTQDPSAGMATLMGSAGLSIQNELRHSRINENEADHQGIKLLFNAGYNPQAMAGFFGKLANQHQLYGFKVPEILLTHPVSESRLAQAQARAYQFIYNPNKEPSLDFDLIQIKILGGRIPVGFKTSYPDTVKCYSKLLLDKTEGFSCLNMALNHYPNNRLLRSLEAERVFINDPNLAIKKLKELNAIYPQDFAIIIQLAQAYKENNQLDAAIELLNKLIPEQRYRYELYNLLAEIYSKTDKNHYAYLSQARAQLEIGNKAHAEHMLKQAENLNKNKDLNFNKDLEKMRLELDKTS